MRLISALLVALMLASCTARESSPTDRLDALESAFAESRAPGAPARYLFTYDLEFLIAPANGGSAPTVVGYGRLNMEMRYEGTDVRSVRCRFFGFDQSSCRSAGVDLPRFRGEYEIDMSMTPDRWSTSFKPLAIDHEMRFEFPALNGDVSEAEGSWSFTTVGGTNVSGPLTVRAFLLKCPGVWGP